MITLKELNDTANKVFDGENTQLYFELPDGKIIELCNITKGKNGQLILRGETLLK